MAYLFITMLCLLSFVACIPHKGHRRGHLLNHFHINFVTIIVCSISPLIIKQVRICVKPKSIRFRAFVLAYYAIMIFLITSVGSIIFMYIILIQLVYALLALGQSAAITAGPAYTVLTLISSAAISFVSWMLKNKSLSV